MIDVTYIPRKMTGVELYELLSKHRLLSNQMEEPNVCIAMAESADVGFLHEGERVLAVVIETHPSEKTVELLWVNEVSRLHQKKDFLAEASKALRKRWFEEKGYSRVGVHIPIARTQTIRTLKALGFRLETMPWGIRDAVGYGNHLESLAILGLLPTDPVKSWSPLIEVVEESILSEAG
jgi:hypothetical protein